ncbi:protein phosphatase 2c [Holotrichia oblita]|uniref:Protein phosphatase 2c n=2 Tax=Holotrichia oblita TaxID=644536 RepID=A0ACB9T294_HOLOL|nr:protein phosphatase 2c [Holotrichia oblita]KAI4460908.1 protein phosphatase 2c [Holotrichia oblita]
MRSLRPEQTYQASKSWTDDLPVCKESGIGSSTNQIYREDGNRQEEHEFEDRFFHIKFDTNSYLYGVFDGYEGAKAVEFCSQRMPAEIVLGQLKDKKTDEEIKEVLRQAFMYVEKSYMDSIYDLLAERAMLSYDIPEGLNNYEAYKQVPQVVENIKRINYELSSGATAAIALIYNNKLYIANVGTCRVLLCLTDSNSVLKVVQLSVDHNLRNEDELLRLSQIGINAANLRRCTHLGNQGNTRCLGNYLVKGGYKEFEDLVEAKQEPVISEPDIIGGITLDESCRFLLMMSSGFYHSLEEAMGTEQVNKYIAQCVVEQFREQTTLPSVAQAVVDKVVRQHHDWYMSSSASNPSTKREDITLLVRNFNYILLNANKSPTNPAISFNPVVVPNVLTNNNTTTYNSNITSTVSTVHNDNESEIGEDNKMDAYVDFSTFYQNYAIAKTDGTLPNCLEF